MSITFMLYFCSDQDVAFSLFSIVINSYVGLAWLRSHLMI